MTQSKKEPELIKTFTDLHKENIKSAILKNSKRGKKKYDTKYKYKSIRR